MARLLTPKLVRRGFEIFIVASLAGFGATLAYGNNLPAFVAALGRLQWGWIVAGIGLAAMDWIGGGLRLWLLARHIHPQPSLKGMILAGGMGAWGAYVTPLQSGAGPMIMYTMRRYGVPLPAAVTTTLMSFVATVAFFAIAGPLAVAFGAGRSLGARGNVLGLSVYDLFLGSLTVFGGLGVLMVVVIVFPGLIRHVIHAAADRLSRSRPMLASRLERLRVGIDEAHGSVVAFNSPRGWATLAGATILSGPSHANKLLAGYVTLRALGIEAHFVDVLLVQTLVMFLLYFAPTPGAAGLAELISAAVMSIYVPRPLTPIYTLIWRMIMSYYTVGFGFLVFAGWVRHGLKAVETDLPEEVAVADPVG